MGWLIYNYTPRDIRGEIHSICSVEGKTRTLRPIASEQVGDVWYVAVRAESKDADVGRACAEEMGYTPNADGSYVFAVVILTSIKNGEWGYKHLDEGCGPTASEAPQSVLAHLSPTTQKWAVGWRKRCRDNLKRGA